MKIDLITLHAIKNYGSVLQTLATQEKFKEYGHEVRVINFIREDALEENLLKTWCGDNLVKKIIMFPTILRWKKVFNNFLKDNINLTEESYTYEDDFKFFESDADLFCTGSDQVWNTKWNNGIIRPLYFSFLDSSKKRFAYASSFGKSRLEEWEISETKELIEKYEAIAVREDTAVSILQEQYEYKEALQIVDPTLVMPGSFWRKYSTQSKIKEKYVLIYNLNRSKDFDKFAVNFAKKQGLKLVRFCTRYDQIFRAGKSILIPEIYDFITLIDNAEYVITDSFHATAFSLNLNTRPICIYPKEYGGRISSILKLTETEQCHLRNYDDFDIVNRSVDFDKVNRIFNQEREKGRWIFKKYI